MEPEGEVTPIVASSRCAAPSFASLRPRTARTSVPRAPSTLRRWTPDHLQTWAQRGQAPLAARADPIPVQPEHHLPFARAQPAMADRAKLEQIREGCLSLIVVKIESITMVKICF